MGTEVEYQPIQRALISVSDKEGVAELARQLAAQRVEIYSTGGTARHLASEGLVVKDVANYTEFPEMLDGRVKTLHPKIFAGILGRLDHAEDQATFRRFGILAFGLVVVNLYPFEKTTQASQVTDEEAIEQIDIGGPSLIRAAAKNHAYVTVLTRPDQYASFVKEWLEHGGTSASFRRHCMVGAFEHTARYDRAISEYFRSAGPENGVHAELTGEQGFPAELKLNLRLREVLRYGENSHQRGALYGWPGENTGTLVGAIQHHGKPLSYNNLLDLDAGWQLVASQSEAACVVIKHNNPCGAALGTDVRDACRQAFEGDSLSAFGGVTAMNRVLDLATAEWLCENRDLFVEAIAARGFEDRALELLTTQAKWRTNVRLLTIGGERTDTHPWELRSIAGGLLVQDADFAVDSRQEWRPVTPVPIDELMWRDLEFAWSVVRIVKSNAIVVVRDGVVVGVGAGQMSRVDAVRIALEKAGERSRGAALASDAFFPFADSIELAAAAGIRSVVQPGGAKRDEEVIQAAAAAGIAMCVTGVRHFRH
ncbi:MAG TPA: bifunctional phosphoribosylaminoimidazolecarboxamide formyltransferase/IMP cyclohydrolase [Pirellulaceae bacterium]|nr:bifunctional phosphoribosylaminoimidazolecarboxamide formyltransferase/IMP cyclohydrolase [Pirellulaceae bacterium]